MTPASDCIEVVPAPWTLKGTIYSFLFHVSSQQAAHLSTHKDFLFGPLESDSSFSDGLFLGGLASVQVVRYSESPAGPYDELIVVPGKFGYQVQETGKDGSTVLVKKKNLRVSRAFVSQEKTCWNGRNNWNIPKHLAHFEFKPLPNNAVAISISPLVPGDAGAEWAACKTPFFSATYRPIPYLPAFPCSTDLFGYIGIDMTLVQPPLPGSDESARGELVESKQWCAVVPYESSSRTSLGWWDLKQGGAGENSEETALLSGGGNVEGGMSGYDNWWPGIGRWQIGMMMENATIRFPEGKYWDGPDGERSRL